VAALFGLHPLHVESVAWAAERKDVLSGLFFMLTLYTYARFADGQSRETEQAQTTGTQAEAVPQPPEQSGAGIWYILSFICFVLGLLSKPMLVTVPVMLLLLDWWPLRRFAWPGFGETGRTPTWHLVREKLPFLAAALALGLLTIFSQNKIGALQPTLQISLRSRLANAVLSYAEYLAQAVWPTRLGAFYSMPQSFSVWSTVGILVAGGIILAIAFYSAHTRPFLAVGWLWYLVMLLPVIGLLQVGHQAHADRYTYLPLIGIFIMVSWGAFELVGRYDVGRVLLPIVGIGLVALCIGLTRQQVRYWKDSETLWRHMLALSWDNAVAHSHLGTILSQKGQRDAAIAEYREALRVAPGYALARIKLGVALAEKGDVNEAIFQLETAVKTAPNDLDAQYNLGVALMSQGRYEQALLHFQEALRIRPGYPRAESNVQAIRALKASQLEHSQSGNR
jgi:tetratricopeptide (TPR) repeat protein